ncbi:MAG: hypothetical protein HQL89_15285 [Magnetococcales bacterium]|nr:hypothetical protein [Magnetococcales bacterium]
MPGDIYLRSAKNNVIEAVKRVESGALDLLSIFQSGQKYLKEHPTTDRCPLCGSSENIVGLSTRIDQKIQDLSSLDESQMIETKCYKKLNDEQIFLDLLKGKFSKSRDDFLSLRNSTTWPVEVVFPATLPPEEQSLLAVWLDSIKAFREKLFDIDEVWSGQKQFRADVKKALTQYQNNFEIYNRLATQLGFAMKAHTVMINERISFTDKIIQDISDDICQIYNEIHPGEGLNKISMQLDQKRRASLELNSEFCSHSAPPQAYFSQSHLDTLGLCVFLALALRDEPERTILIMDDVIGSIDEPHVERVIEAIYEYSKKFQHCIVTTHYRPWREKYRWGWLKNGHCQFVELSNWELSQGVRITGSLPEIERLKRLLAEEPPDIQSICGKAGVILEAALDYLTQKYECRVPRKSGNVFTLGDLIPALDKKLRQALKVEIRIEDSDSGAPVFKSEPLGPILDELERISQTRNAFGAHFKEISFELLDSDAIRFAQLVVKLMESMTHPEDGWPSSKKSGSHWATRFDFRRLHPLVKPT